MPKKRFSSHNLKPACTPHPSLSSSSTTTSFDNTQPSVNQLISNLRRTGSKPFKANPSINAIPTLPPGVRQLLSQTETPAPKPRLRYESLLSSGILTPAGPSPPQSWVSEKNRCISAEKYIEFNTDDRVPHDIYHLPGLDKTGNQLRDICLRIMAQKWQFIQEYEKYNLAELPTYLRMSLLSYIAVYGPKDGVGYEGLKSILLHPLKNLDLVHHTVKNETFFRLDLSRAAGHSISLEQIMELVRPKSPPAQMNNDDLTWEDNFSLSMSLSPPLAYLTHLSLSHPCPSTSWPCLLKLMTHTPSLTHLSLAYWPVPSEIPMSKSMSHTRRHSRLVEVIDFSEAADILSRLAGKLPGLEYLDLTGCQRWIDALAEKKPDDYARKIEWGFQWSQLQTVQLKCGSVFGNCDEERKRIRKLNTRKIAVAVETRIHNLLKLSKAQGRVFRWINFCMD